MFPTLLSILFSGGLSVHLFLFSPVKMETPSIAAVTLQAPENEAAVIPQPQPHPPSLEVDSSPVDGSLNDVVASEIPSDDDIDHEPNCGGEDRDQDHGDNLVETDIVVVPIDELKPKIIRQASTFCVLDPVF